MSGKRTPEQQAAYNEKRRQENATKKKAETAKVLKKVKPALKKLNKRLDKPLPKFAMKTNAARQIKGVGEPLKPLKNFGDKVTKALAQRDKTNARLDVAAQVKKLGADSLLPPAKKEVRKLIVSQTTPAPAAVDKTRLTNARSYRKKITGVGATIRGKMYQVTVTFTDTQFGTLKSAAEFRACSIAEAIRQAVLKEHGSALGQ